MAWFKNAIIFRIGTPFALKVEQVDEALQPFRFAPASKLEMQTIGWVPPRPDGDLVYRQGKQWLLSFRTEKKLLPASVINAAAKEKAAEIEEQDGYKPGRKQMREIKDAVTEMLLPQAFSIHKDTRVWIDTERGTLAIDTSSTGRVDDILTALNKALGGFPLSALHVEVAPATAMTNWLAEDEAPAGFSIDQDTELCAKGESRATIRYTRQSVDVADVRKHIEAGKQASKLALTWNDRISFVLTDSMLIKRITALEVVQESADASAETAEEQFDADFVLMTGELGNLFAGVIEALGGLKRDPSMATPAMEPVEDLQAA